MTDLSQPVVLKGQSRDFAEYVATVKTEQASATAWLTPPDAEWTVPESLRKKVGDDGRILPYPGDTVVLPLDRFAISACRKLQTHLRERLELAERLDPPTFHVTLHDLSHGPDAAPHLESNAARCRERFAVLAAALPESAIVTLIPTAVYPSVNVSVVLGLVPATDNDFRILMNAYNLFEDIVCPPYWPRLHVTLDYFRPQPLDTRALHAALPSPPVEAIHLDMRQLAYQRFSDMNHYDTLFTVSDLPQRR